MNYEDVQKVSNAAKNKIGLLNGNFLKYFLRAVMAGFFIDVAVIYSNVAGNVLHKMYCDSLSFYIIVMQGGILLWEERELAEYIVLQLFI